MDLRSLNSATMAALSSAWVGEQKNLFLSIQEIAGLWPQIKANYDDLMQIQDARKKQQTLKALTEDLAATDRRYDNAIRTIWNTLEAQIDWALAQDDQDQASRLEDLRARLLPEGLTWTNRTYLDEAGNATRVMAQLEPATRTMLESIPVADGTLLDVVTFWSKEGARLADLVRRRSIIEETTEQVPDEYQTSLTWVRLVNAMLTLLDLSTAPQDAIVAIRQPVVDAVATNSSTSSKSTSTDDESPNDPSTTGTEPTESTS